MGRTGASARQLMLLVLLPFLLWVLAFEILPALGILVASFQGDNGQGFTLGQYARALQSKLYLQALRNSFLIALESGIAGTLIGFVCAYSFTRFNGRIRDQLLMISNVMTNFAGVPLAFAYIVLLGNNGMITLFLHKLGWSVTGTIDVYSWMGLTLVYIYFQVPLSILLLYPAFYGIREEWREASALLGAGTLRFWRHIGIPYMLPGIVGTFSILFANALGAYATAYALTNNFNLMSIRIGNLVSGDVFARPELGSALAVFLALTMLLALWINENMLKRMGRGPS